MVRTAKKEIVVKLPLHPELQAALDILPAAGGTADPIYFFESGNGTKRSATRDMTRTLRAVFVKSGVPGAHAHRFRHTLLAMVIHPTGAYQGSALGGVRLWHILGTDEKAACTRFIPRE